MCIPVSRLFWISSLAYPNLLGTKGYVVVVVLSGYIKLAPVYPQLPVFPVQKPVRSNQTGRIALHRQPTTGWMYGEKKKIDSASPVAGIQRSTNKRPTNTWHRIIWAA
jgi:hypothetical protein